MMLSLVSPVPRRAASHDKIHNLASQTAAEVGGWGGVRTLGGLPPHCCTLTEPPAPQTVLHYGLVHKRRSQSSDQGPKLQLVPDIICSTSGFSQVITRDPSPLREAPTELSPPALYLLRVRARRSAPRGNRLQVLRRPRSRLTDAQRLAPLHCHTTCQAR